MTGFKQDFIHKTTGKRAWGKLMAGVACSALLIPLTTYAVAAVSDGPVSQVAVQAEGPQLPEGWEKDQVDFILQAPQAKQAGTKPSKIVKLGLGGEFSMIRS